jgi:competence protein ComEA
MKTWQSLLFGILLGLLMSGSILLIASSPSGHEVTIIPPPTAKPAMVYIDGEVKKPGLYLLPYGSLLKDIIQAAGGLTQNSDIAKINLASKIIDGEKITIPEISNQSEKIMGISTLDKPGNLVNINTANQAELDILPGIGPSKALDILKYRNEHGIFRSIEEINKVPGIGPTIYSQIKDFIFINP